MLRPTLPVPLYVKVTGQSVGETSRKTRLITKSLVDFVILELNRRVYKEHEVLKKQRCRTLWMCSDRTNE